MPGGFQSDDSDFDATYDELMGDLDTTDDSMNEDEEIVMDSEDIFDAETDEADDDGSATVDGNAAAGEDADDPRGTGMQIGYDRRSTIPLHSSFRDRSATIMFCRMQATT